MKKEPSLFLALVPVISMLVLLGGGVGGYDLPPEPLIIVSTVIAGIIAIYLGYSFDDIMNSVADKVGKTIPAILILVTVGLMIGAWMIGGTIPMLIYYGLKIISPTFVVVTAFFVTSIIAICTGTSWGGSWNNWCCFYGSSYRHGC